MAGGNTSYHGLQFRYEKRLAQGLSVLAHYTISKMLDNCGDGTSNYDFLGGGRPSRTTLTCTTSALFPPATFRSVWS